LDRRCYSPAKAVRAVGHDPSNPEEESIAVLKVSRAKNAFSEQKALKMYCLTGFTVTGGGQILLILFCKGTKSSQIS
jgi:hypothetical protein